MHYLFLLLLFRQALLFYFENPAKSIFSLTLRNRNKKSPSGNFDAFRYQRLKVSPADLNQTVFVKPLMPTKQTGGQEGFPTGPTERSKNCIALKVACMAEKSVSFGAREIY